MESGDSEEGLISDSPSYLYLVFERNRARHYKVSSLTQASVESSPGGMSLYCVGRRQPLQNMCG